MPSLVRPLSSDFPVFAPVRRWSRGVGAVGATPLPPSTRLSAIPVSALPLDRSVGFAERGNSAISATPLPPEESLELGEELLACADGGVPDLRTGRAEKSISSAS